MGMQRNANIFEAFGDGICSFHEIDEDGNAGKARASIRFQERTIGVKRHYEAMTAKVQVDRLIRIPYQKWVTSECLAAIDGQIYEIRQVQAIMDTRPKCSDISLHRTRQRRGLDGAV